MLSVAIFAQAILAQEQKHRAQVPHPSRGLSRASISFTTLTMIQILIMILALQGLRAHKHEYDDGPPHSPRNSSRSLSIKDTKTILAEKVVKGGTELALSELHDGPDAHHGPVAHYYWKPPIRSTAPGPSAQGVFPQLGISVHDNHSMGLLLPGAIAGVADEWLGTTKRMLLLGERYCCLLRLLLLLPLCWCPVAAAALLVLRLLLALQALPLLQPLPAAFYSTVNPAAAFVTLSMPTGMATNHHNVNIHIDALIHYHTSAGHKYAKQHMGYTNPTHHDKGCATAQRH